MEEIVFTGDKADYLTMKTGDVLYSQKLKMQVRVEQIKSPTKITVRAGNITTVVTADDLYHSVVEQNKRVVKNRQQRTSGAHTQINTERSARNEINVIGQTVDEAVVNVDAFIDQAVAACQRFGLFTEWAQADFARDFTITSGITPTSRNFALAHTARAKAV